jgi:hypothetical protein
VVEHIMRDPQVVPLSEELPAPGVQEGSCLFCGLWIDPETDGVYQLSISKGEVEGGEYVCHIACLVEKAQPTVPLP